MDRVLSNFGIKVVGQVETIDSLPGVDTAIANFPEAPNYIGEYGDAYAVGLKAEVDAGTASYTYYVYSRPSANTGYTYGYWLDVGRLGIVGPQGIQGETGPKGDTGYTPVWYTGTTSIPTGNYNEGDICIINGPGALAYGNMYKYQRGVWVFIANILGPRGYTGVQGERGQIGPQGPKGDRGLTGPAGQYILIAGTKASSAQLPDPALVTDRRNAYLVGDSAPYELWAIVPNDQGVLEWLMIGYSTPTVDTDDLVTLDTEQEITGNKTFTGTTYFGEENPLSISHYVSTNGTNNFINSVSGGVAQNLTLSNGSANSIKLENSGTLRINSQNTMYLTANGGGDYITMDAGGITLSPVSNIQVFDPESATAVSGQDGQVLKTTGENVAWTSLKTINGQSLVGDGDIEVVEPEPGPEYVKDFNFYPQTTTATATTDGEGTITINGSGSGKFIVVTADTDNYSSYDVAYSHSPNAWQFIFYTNDTNVYAFRFMSETELRIQRFNYTTFSGGVVTTLDMQVDSITFSTNTNMNIKIEYENSLVSLYIDDVLIATYDMTALMSATGKNVSGLATNLATGTDLQLITNWLVGATPTPELVIDTELNVDSSNPIANYVVARKFEEYTPTDNRVKYSHFSLDDFYLAFEDLTTNTPASIFDNATFAWLKTFHETTGATISCYCFYQNAASNPTFTLDMVPTTWRNEFQANSDWLKFGFHALYSGINYASATAEVAAAAYNTTIAALVNITGSTDCIDKIPRLHNFAGSLEACKAMRDAQCGCRGFLAAIAASDGTVRQSYYLEEEFNNYLFTHDYLYDPSTQLHFIRTQDGGNIYNVRLYNTDLKYANINKYVEFFTHEVQLTDGTKSAYITYFNILKATHKPVFWQNILS